MTVFQSTKKAISVILPAIKELDKDVMIHVLTICIDRYCSDRFMSCNDKCDLAYEIYHNFDELRRNV